jgi:hypothetical protein
MRLTVKVAVVGGINARLVKSRAGNGVSRSEVADCQLALQSRVQKEWGGARVPLLNAVAHKVLKYMCVDFLGRGDVGVAVGYIALLELSKPASIE